MAVKQIDPTLLVEDFSIYPRHQVDTNWVGMLGQVIDAGVTKWEGGPVVVTEDLRIVDGWHRTRAHIRRGTKKIPVDVRKYPDEAAVLREAVALNSIHGRKLDSQDRTRSALLLKNAGVTETDIAVTLHITEKKVIELTAKVVRVKRNGNTTLEPAKPSLWPKRGEEPQTVTPEQYETHRSSNGWRTGQAVTQLSNELEAGLIDMWDPVLRPKLERLRDMLVERL